MDIAGARGNAMHRNMISSDGRGGSNPNVAWV
jgi:hypothetical protein